MSVEKRKIFKIAKKYLFHGAVAASILIPAIMITIPGCSLFYKCGKPGYRWNGSCTSAYIYYSCDSPCSPTRSSSYEGNISGSGSHTSTATVYCEESNYETSDGIRVQINGC